MTKPAVVPIKFMQFQAVLAKIGYELIARNPKGGINFKANALAVKNGFTPFITVLEPDFLAEDGVSLAYEKDYVIDLLVQISGASDSESSVKMLARRDFN